MTLRSRSPRLGTVLLLCLPLLAACEPPAAQPQTIRGQLPGYPHPNPSYTAKVMVPGHAPVTPDASGAFEIPDVKLPYDLVVYFPADAGMGVVVVLQGLQRNDPTLPANFFRSRKTWVSGTISGPSFPLPPHGRLAAFFEAPFSIDPRFTLTQRNYSQQAAWVGAETVTGTLHAMELGEDPSTGAPTYGSYGRREGVTLTQGVPLTGQDITLSPIGTASVTGRVSGTAGLPLLETAVSLETAHGSGMRLFTHAPTTNDLRMAVPDLAGATFKVEAFLRGEDAHEFATVWKTGVRAGTTDLVLTPPAPPRLLSPASEAQVSDLSAGFSWEGPAHALHTVYLYPSTADEPTYQLFTPHSRATLPDLSPLGLTGPRRGTRYSWSVHSQGPMDSVDEWMRPTPRPADSQFNTGAGLRTLTTAP